MDVFQPLGACCSPGLAAELCFRHELTVKRVTNTRFYLGARGLLRPRTPFSDGYDRVEFSLDS